MIGTAIDDLLDDIHFLMGTTDKLVPWNDVRSAVEGQNPLTERERCEMLLRVANGDALSLAEWKRLVGAGLPGPTDGPRKVPRDNVTALRAALMRITKKPGTALLAFGDDVARIVNGNVIVIPELAVIGRRRERYEHVIARSAAEALMYAVWLLLDPTKDYGRSLRCCRLPSCGRFAFVPPPTSPGQPPKYYCDDQHRREHQTIFERERKRVYRIKRREESA